MTSFETVYKRAIFKFTEFGFKNMISDLREELLQQHLLSSISDFEYSSPNVREYDLEAETFVKDLSNAEIEILALGVAVHWLQPKILNSDHLSPQFHNSDMKSYSPAQTINSMLGLLTKMENTYNGKIKTHSYRDSDIANLKP